MFRARLGRRYFRNHVEEMNILALESLKLRLEREKSTGLN